MLTEKTLAPPADKAISAQFPDDAENRLSASHHSITIESAGFLKSLDLRRLWEYRELLYFLALRDVKIRYKQTVLGVAWVILQPVITTIIFTVIFKRLGTAENLSMPYPLFAFSGLALWTFINAAIISCSGSLINHSGLITKVYFPRLVIPISAIGATLLDLLLVMGALFVAMLIYGLLPGAGALLIPLLMIPIVLLTLGIGILTAALNVKYRDVKYILPFAIQVLFFVSPIPYSLKSLPPETVWLWKLNPITGILENFRAALFGLNFDWASLAMSTAISFFVFFLAVYVFYRMEDDFADVI